LKSALGTDRARFWPINPAPGLADDPGVPAAKRVLIIEDDLVVGTGYQRFLQMHGFETEVAADGLLGLEKLAAFQPDAIVLDLIMPKLGGIEVLKRLRTRELFRELPVVVLTKACSPVFMAQATQAGANHILDKANDPPSALLAVLQSLLAARAKAA
jgi:two-component system, OmpR family, response regulator MprA